ncbi:hypothetical protein, partial [Paenibacillus graminis]|uniref:hypothetical protein n=1 Tax=Paenibacillus graminis TaxID=189425 RepID=UPI00055B23AD
SRAVVKRSRAVDERPQAFCFYGILIRPLTIRILSIMIAVLLRILTKQSQLQLLIVKKDWEDL